MADVCAGCSQPTDRVLTVWAKTGDDTDVSARVPVCDQCMTWFRDSVRCAELDRISQAAYRLMMEEHEAKRQGRELDEILREHRPKPLTYRGIPIIDTE